MCLIGDSYSSLYYAWTEAAYVSSRRCLVERFSSSSALGSELAKRYSERDALIKPFDYGAPNTVGYELGTYEHFPPYQCLYNEDGSFKDRYYTSNANCGRIDCAEE